jgi:hypothetical protein
MRPPGPPASVFKLLALCFGIIAAGLSGAAGLAGCGSAASGLDGGLNLGNSSGVTTVPGKPADYTGFLANHGGRVVILKSARLLSLKGFRPPRLVRVGIETSRAIVADGLGWPPGGYDHRLASFGGYQVLAGRRAQILYGVVAPSTGEYGDAGIQLTVVAGGSTVTVNVLSAAGTCVKRSLDINCPDRFYNRIQNVSRVPGGGVDAVVGPAVR